MIRSDDLGKTKYTLLPRGNRFLFLEKFLFVAVVNLHHETQVNLYVSSEGGRIFNKARLPFQLTEHSYTILDTSEGSVFLHVNHGDFHTGYGNIYLSDAEGLRFSLSLRNNKRDAQGRCDFEKLQGIEGIYITNEQINADVESAKERPRLRRSPSTRAASGSCSSRRRPTTRGATSRAAPTRTRSARSPRGHRLVGPFYSNKNAIGVVMATGNVGHHLSDKEDEVHTFFSRDAAHVADGAARLAHLRVRRPRRGDRDRRRPPRVDGGAVLVGRGVPWNELRFSNKPTEIENIVIEPQATSQVFVMYGSRGEEGVLFQVDFSQLHEPQCKGDRARRRAVVRLRAVDAHRRPRRRQQVPARPPGAVHAAAARVAVLQRRAVRARRVPQELPVRGGGLRVRLRLRALGGQRPVRRDHGDVVGAAKDVQRLLRGVERVPPRRRRHVRPHAGRRPPADQDALPGDVRRLGRRGVERRLVRATADAVPHRRARLRHRHRPLRALLRPRRAAAARVGRQSRSRRSTSAAAPHVKYGGLGQAPDSADDELDLGEYDEEAEELRDADALAQSRGALGIAAGAHDDARLGGAEAREAAGGRRPRGGCSARSSRRRTACPRRATDRSGGQRWGGWRVDGACGTSGRFPSALGEIN